MAMDAYDEFSSFETVGGLDSPHLSSYHDFYQGELEPSAKFAAMNGQSPTSTVSGQSPASIVSRQSSVVTMTNGSPAMATSTPPYSDDTASGSINHQETGGKRLRRACDACSKRKVKVAIPFPHLSRLTLPSLLCQSFFFLPQYIPLTVLFWSIFVSTNH